MWNKSYKTFVKITKKLIFRLLVRPLSQGRSKKLHVQRKWLIEFKAPYDNIEEKNGRFKPAEDLEYVK